ncbi:MAG: peptide chain release factor N(5)-glutamine methyltransferase [Capnocytophaga sp.]|nr:peptide chain release factor N(5)-glutamine methyltransferase [Capnocytophaga sp.]
MNLINFKKYLSNSLAGNYPQEEIQTFYFILLEHFAGLSKIEILMQTEFEISEEIEKKLQATVNELVSGTPLQYVLGETIFYGNRFFVNENVLIPRQETEELVSWICKNIPENQPFRLLDIGTGSGCIAISIAKKFPEIKVTAIDISEKALETARKNALENDVKIHFVQQNILTSTELPISYDIIVSNPPYVRETEKSEIKNNVLHHEPHLALFVSDENPLLFYEKIADLAKNHLTKNGKLFFEINQYLGNETLAMLQNKGFQSELKKDLNGNDRMVCSTI